MSSVFHSATPIFRIFDVAKAREFYVDFLEFTIDWEHHFQADLPVYMQASHGSLVLHLSEHHGDCCPGSTALARVTGLAEFQQRLIAKQYRYYRPGIERASWGADVMEVIDPFGNRIRFYEETAGEGQ